MPCPFTGPKMFCAGPNFLSQPKNLTAFSAVVWHKKFGPSQNILGPVKGQGNSEFILVFYKFSQLRGPNLRTKMKNFIYGFPMCGLATTGCLEQGALF